MILFTVYKLNRFNKSEIEYYLDKVTDDCPANVKMLFVYFSSHGSRLSTGGNALETSDGKLIYTNDIIATFRKPNLHEKFKIFIFDTCRTKGMYIQQAAHISAMVIRHVIN